MTVCGCENLNEFTAGTDNYINSFNVWEITYDKHSAGCRSEPSGSIPFQKVEKYLVYLSPDQIGR